MSTRKERRRGVRSDFSQEHKAMACERLQIAQGQAHCNDTIITATQSAFLVPGSVLRVLKHHKVPLKWILLLMRQCAGEKAEPPHASATSPKSDQWMHREAESQLRCPRQGMGVTARAGVHADRSSFILQVITSSHRRLVYHPIRLKQDS